MRFVFFHVLPYCPGGKIFYPGPPKAEAPMPKGHPGKSGKTEQYKSRIIEFLVDNSIILLYNSTMREQNWLTKDCAFDHKSLITFFSASIINMSRHMILNEIQLYFNITVLSTVQRFGFPWLSNTNQEFFPVVQLFTAIKTLQKMEDIMTVKKFFRLELTFKMEVKVEKIKESDYGRNRCAKQLLSHLLNDPEALRAIVMIFFFARYFNENDAEICNLMDTVEKEDFYILRAAEKCPPEAQSYFHDLFVSGEAKKKGAMGPDFGSEAALENEWVFDYLQSKLANFVTVKADFNELPAESINNNHNPVKIKKRKMGKIGTVESVLATAP
jgi:hypothetical protein